MSHPLTKLLKQVRRCTVCAPYLPLGPKPILQAGPTARILVASQAPGRKAHEAGRPFADASGERLRAWMGLTPEVFYDPTQIAIIPMGFCYPGRGRGGDLPPRPECAPLWRARLLAQLPELELTLAIGKYAIAYHFLGESDNLTALVRRWRDFWPERVPLPHPSPRNNLWFKRNPWFENELIPELRERVAAILRAKRGQVTR